MALSPVEYFSQFLRLAFLRSPNYVAGVSGWTINQDGSAEFNNVTVRGNLVDSGMFVYNGTGALGNPPIFSVTKPGQTHDPFGNAVVPDAVTTYNAFGAVINVLSMAKSAFFQYADNGSAVQGGLILAVASTASTDPVTGASYVAGLNGINPVFGDFLLAVGSKINLGAATFTQNGQVAIQQGAGAVSPALIVTAPEQGVSGHMAMLMEGTSPDGTHLGQFLIARLATGFTAPTPVTSSLIEFQSPATGLVDSLLQLITAAGGVAGDNMLGIRVSGDTCNRLRVNASGRLAWGPGNAGQDCSLQRTAANLLQFQTTDVDIATAGRGLRVAEGANAKQGVATLAAGTVVVANTSVTATSRIFLTAQDNNSTGALRVSARTAGTSFTITSSNAADSGVVAWEIVEPG